MLSKQYYNATHHDNKKSSDNVMGLIEHMLNVIEKFDEQKSKILSDNMSNDGQKQKYMKLLEITLKNCYKKIVLSGMDNSE